MNPFSLKPNLKSAKNRTTLKRRRRQPFLHLEFMEDRLAPAVLTSIADGNWNIGSTWDTGTAPTTGDEIIIPTGKIVTYDATDPDTIGKITVNGTLSFKTDSTLLLTTNANIEVANGTLSMRPASANFTHTITFAGIIEANFVGGGNTVLATDVGLWITGGGKLDVIGTDKTPWTRLTGSANAGATVITVQDATGWRVGDTLVLTPTQAPTVGTASYTGYDERTITAIAGNSITLSSALTNNHPMVNGTWTAEVLNVTRNVLIQGTATGRTHVAFMLANQQQTIKNLELRYTGPQKLDGSGNLMSIGRYGLHFHHMEDASRGSLVENVVVRDSGSHAFVAHASHGITFEGTISHNTYDDAYWWDPGHNTHDTIMNNTVASKIQMIPSFRGFRLTGYRLGEGNNNTLTNSVAVGVQGNVDASGFEWPENTINSEWVFNNNIGHNNKIHGIFTWQNGSNFHLIEDFVMYYNSDSGIDHGAYGNRYHYRNGILYGNKNNGFQLHSISSSDVISPMLIENLTIDGGGITPNGILVQAHNTQVSMVAPTTIRDNTIQNLAAGGKAIKWSYSGIASGQGDVGGETHAFGNHREWFKIINNSFDGTYANLFSLTGFWTDLDGDTQIDWADTDGDGFIEDLEADGSRNEKFGLLAGSDIYVETPDGEAFRLRSIWYDAQSLPTDTNWNAKKEQIRAAGTPIVDAGRQQSILQPDTNAYLDGTVIDNLLPNPPGVTITWSKISGPGNVTFGNASAIDTTATFSSAGVYVLRLTANDGALSHFDDTTVIVNTANPSNSVSETWTAANGTAWPSQWTRENLSGTATVDVQANEGRIAPATSSGVMMSINTHNAENVDLKTTFRVNNNSIQAGLIARRNDSDPDTYFAVTTGSGAGSGDDMRIYKVVDGVATNLITAPKIIASNVNYNMRFRVESNADGSTNLQLKIWSTAVSEPTAWTLQVLSFNNEPRLQGVSGRFGVLAKCSTSRTAYFDNFQATILANQAPTANAGADQTITLPASATLDGTVADDGQPYLPGSLTTTWSKISGPGNVTFGNANAVDTTATFSAAGTYVLRLTADDGELASFDEVTITANNSVFTETWTGTNGSAWPAQWTRENISGTAPSVTIQSNEGRVLVASGGAVGQVLNYINSANAKDVDQTVQIRVNNNSAYPGLIARRADGDSDTYYDVRIGTGAGSNPYLTIRKIVDGVATNIGQVAQTIVSGSNYNLRFQVVTNGNTTDLKAKYWLTTVSEPATWNLSVTGNTEARLQGVSGRFGVKASVQLSNRSATFDNYSATIIQALTAEGGEIANSSAATLRQQDLRQLVQEAKSYWIAQGVSPSALAGIQVQIVNLGGATLGQTVDNTIQIDSNAAGYGWFIDRTPGEDSEFVSGGPAGMDLLSVLVHEFGHALGQEHSETGVMDDSLAVGTRTASLQDLSPRFGKPAGRGHAANVLSQLEIDLLAGLPDDLLGVEV